MDFNKKLIFTTRIELFWSISFHSYTNSNIYRLFNNFNICKTRRGQQMKKTKELEQEQVHKRASRAGEN